jgi:hypothetical protein
VRLRLHPLPSSDLPHTLNTPHSSHKLVDAQTTTLSIPTLISPSRCPPEVREHTFAHTLLPTLWRLRVLVISPSNRRSIYPLSGLSESEPGDSTLGVVLDSLLPSYKEVLSPTPLPTYLGSYSLHKLPATDTGLGPSETLSTNPRKRLHLV